MSRICQFSVTVGGEHCCFAIGLPVEEDERFSPARAGNTSPPASPMLDAAVQRFSPARAGNTIWPPSWRPETVPVQPRACGEHYRCRKPVSDPQHRFSPARAGNTATRQGRRHYAQEHRFSPARAGNTRHAAQLQTSATCTVQPRACGEHIGSSMSCRRERTSVQPRACGEHSSLVPLGRHGARRFSPARAGNTRRTSALLPGPGSSVQPRACGEHELNRHNSPNVNGSAPRVRGTLVMPRLSRLRLRFSPARAGNTPAMHRAGASSTVQPRACGEHNAPYAIYVHEDGSAPRVRGTRGLVGRRGRGDRFSPARAGNTCRCPS